MKQKYQAPFLAVLFLLLLFVATVLAQTSAGFNLEWHVIGSGGGESSSASYVVNGTMGQGVASPPLGDGTAFSVGSGYWVVDSRTAVYLPVAFKN